MNNKNNFAFTLIELLAVIVILIIVLAITIPKMSALIDNAKKDSFKNNVKLIIKAIETKKAIEPEYDVYGLNIDSMETDLGIGNDNYKSISVSIVDGKINIDAVGQNKWDGLEAHGTTDSLVIGPKSNPNSCIAKDDKIIVTDYYVSETTYEYQSATTELSLSAYLNGYGTINLDFSFPLGNKTYSTLYVSTNGFVAFSPDLASQNISNNTIADAFPMIAPFWDVYKLNKSIVPTTGIFYDIGEIDNKSYVVIEFRDFLAYQYQSINSTVDFEVYIYEDGLIKMSYQDVSFNQPIYNNGLSATVGINSDTGHYQYSYNKDSLHDSMTLSFTHNTYTTDLPIASNNCFTFDSVTGTIVDYDEQNNSCKSSFIIPETINGVPVQHIGKDAFRKSGIKNVILPNGLLTIGEFSFISDKLTCITIPENVTYLGEYSFARNNIENVIIPESVTNIMGSAFSSNHLAEVSIPSSVTTIGNFAFAKNFLNKLEIPTSVAHIGKGAFNNNLLSEEQAFIYARNIDGSVNNAVLVSYGGAKKDNIIIPNNITVIGASSFEDISLLSATIPNSVTSIEDWAFAYNLFTEITIPSSVITIKNSAFETNQLVNVNITNGVTTLGDSSFYDNKLTGILIPNSVTTIGSSAFEENFILQGEAKIDNYSDKVTIDTSAFDYNGVDSSINITPIFLRNY